MCCSAPTAVAPAPAVEETPAPEVQDEQEAEVQAEVQAEEEAEMEVGRLVKIDTRVTHATRMTSLRFAHVGCCCGAHVS